jgi:tryptophan synthase beta chain
MTPTAALARSRVAGGSPAPAVRRRGRAGVLEEIAARRAVDVSAELGDASYRYLARAAAAAPPPRDVLLRLARPGLHLVAEVKRSSPSAGAIAAPALDPAVQARAYEAGGASAISVLCEPHWFGGSVDDLRAVRAAVAVPVLAKDFVVDPRQLPVLRAAGADLVLLLAALHPARRLADLVARARDLGLEPLVEIHAGRELDAALASGARIVGVNSRDLRTLEVDPDHPIRLRPGIPDDRITIAESGARDPAIVARWRAAGYDAALVGEALVRSADPRAAATAFVAAGAVPDDPGAAHRIPLVKICGVVDEAGLDAALAAGADAIGLNFVAGTPRALSIAEGAALARRARAAGGTRTPALTAIVANPDDALLAALAADVNVDAIQYAGGEPPEWIARSPRTAWAVLHLPSAAPDDATARAGVVDATVVRARAHLAAGAARIVLDTAGGPHPGGTGTRADTSLAAAVAREVPVILAGGLDPASVAGALLAVPAVGVDVASGVEEPRVPGERPRKDPFAVALFAKRARAARLDRPNTPAGPTPVHPGLLEADERGHWGAERDFGGRFVPETLVGALEQLEAAWAVLRHDPVFWAELRELLARFAGRPTALYRADRLADAVLAEAARRRAMDSAGTAGRAGRREAPPLPARLHLHLKREDLAHTGAHKVNNALGQALLTRRLGKSRVIAETGAGQHGVATATACALLGLPCVVFMGEEDIRRQAPNVLRMRALGAEVRSVTSGTATLKDAVNEAMRDWVTNVATTHYVLGSAMGPHPYPTIVRDLQRRIGDEAAGQLLGVEGRLPDLALACVGGGSNAIGLLARFIGEPSVRLAVAEAAGDGIETGRHAAAILGGTPGILHGSRSLMLQDRDGQVVEAVSASAGLDYPGVGPQLAALAEAGRISIASATDREAVAAMKVVTLTEGILPALETAHAIAALPMLLAGPTGRAGSAGRRAAAAPWPDETVVLVGFSGRGDKDLAALERFADVEPWEGVR